jgi:hypothetical protein
MLDDIDSGPTPTRLDEMPPGPALGAHRVALHRVAGHATVRRRLMAPGTRLRHRRPPLVGHREHPPIAAPVAAPVEVLAGERADGILRVVMGQRVHVVPVAFHPLAGPAVPQRPRRAGALPPTLGTVAEGQLEASDDSDLAACDQPLQWPVSHQDATVAAIPPPSRAPIVRRRTGVRQWMTHGTRKAVPTRRCPRAGRGHRGSSAGITPPGTPSRT